MLTVTRAYVLAVGGGAVASSRLGAIVLLALGAFNVNAAERQPVTTVKPLLITAIDQGEAQGVLVGEAAQFISRTFKSTAPIEIDVKTVHALEEPGCMRLAVTTSQEGVLDFNREMRDTRPARKAFTYQLSYCRDGRTPQTNEVSP